MRYHIPSSNIASSGYELASLKINKVRETYYRLKTFSVLPRPCLVVKLERDIPKLPGLSSSNEIMV